MASDATTLTRQHKALFLKCFDFKGWRASILQQVGNGDWGV
jgi:hypothetical protein